MRRRTDPPPKAQPPPRGEIASSPLLLSHAALVGLTPLIPVPLVDDAVKGYLERRLVREIALARGLILTDEQVRAVAEGPQQGVLAQLGRGALLLPVRLLFRKVFLVLEVKRASDAASECFHRGYLLDAALRARAHPPHVSAGELREAIDRVLRAVTHSPLRAAVEAAFSRSQGTLRKGVTALVSALRGGGEVVSEERLGAAAAEAEAVGLAGRLRAAIAGVPDAHFEQLEARLRRELGGRGVW